MGDQSRSSALDEQLKEYIAEWRKQRVKEEEELKMLKDKCSKRKVEREDEERRMAEKKKQEELQRQRDVEEKKLKEQEEKRRRLEEIEKKRQAMMTALKDQTAKNRGPNFTVSKKASELQQLSDAQIERNKTKEQLEEEKKIALSIRIKPLKIQGLDIEIMRIKTQELYDTIVKLETEIYDLEERVKRQNYDLKELKERQRQQLRHKAMKRGLDPEALTGRYPPKLQIASKYERRVDTRSYDDKKQLFEGGWEILNDDYYERMWYAKYEIFSNRTKNKLPKWFGERPGKRKDDPDTPEGEEELKAPGEEEAPATAPLEPIEDEEAEDEEKEEGEEEEKEGDEEEEEEDEEEDEEGESEGEGEGGEKEGKEEEAKEGGEGGEGGEEKEEEEEEEE